MSLFEEVARQRGLPDHVKVGTRVTVNGRPGVITGANQSANLNVKFDDGTTGNCHPGWKMEFEPPTGEVASCE